MPSLELMPLSQANPRLMVALMGEEERAWFSELGWDFSQIRKILTAFIEQSLLPGFVAIKDGKAVGYAYFLIHSGKGILGSLFISKEDYPPEVAEDLLSLAVDALKSAEAIHRIEAQLMPFHNTNLTAAFTRHGFRVYRRYFLELDLNIGPWRREHNPDLRILPWSPPFLPLISEVLFLSYRDEIDATLCDDYRSLPDCEGYLRSLIENPGCGVFMPDASFLGLDDHGKPCGFVLGSRISDSGGMIPQIAILPSQQGCGMGKALMQHALSQFRAIGLHTVSLTVTKANQRAFAWYQRLGFRIRKEFGAYVWERP